MLATATSRKPAPALALRGIVGRTCVRPTALHNSLLSGGNLLTRADAGPPVFAFLTLWLGPSMKVTPVPDRRNALLATGLDSGLHTCEEPLEQLSILGSGDLGKLVAVTHEEHAAEV